MPYKNKFGYINILIYFYCMAKEQLPNVKVSLEAHNAVAKFVVGTKYTIGSFFAEAALEKLNEKIKKSKSKYQP